MPQASNAGTRIDACLPCMTSSLRRLSPCRHRQSQLTKPPRSPPYLPLQGGGRPAKRVGWESRHKHRIRGEVGPPPGAFGATLPLAGLSDSHILAAQGAAEFDALEVGEPPAHHLWAWFAIVACPAAETTHDPGR